METKPYLIFKQNGLLWGVEVACVREIFFLPELKPIAEAPPDILGRSILGGISAVMDLNLRFGICGTSIVWQIERLLYNGKKFELPSLLMKLPKLSRSRKMQ